MAKIDGNSAPQTITPPQDLNIEIKGKEGKIQISVDNSFGTGKADPKTELSITYGMIEATVSKADLATLLATFRTKTEDLNLKTSSENAQAIKLKKQTQAQARLDKIEEVNKKIEDSAKSGKIGKIFGWIAAAAMIAAGALLMIAGGAGAALIIAGAAMMTVMALQETGAMEQIMEGLTNLGKMMGMSDEEAAIFATAVVATVVIAVAVAATVAGGPAAGMAVASSGLGMLATPENLEAMGVDPEKSAAIAMGIQIGLALLAVGSGIGSAAGSSGKMAQLASKGNMFAKVMKGFASQGKLAGVSARIASKVPASAQACARVGGYCAQGINGAATIGAGAAGIDAAVKMSDAQKLEADQKELEAFLAKLQAMFDDEGERIEEILGRLDEIMSSVMQIMKGDDALTTQVIKTI